ncbi:MAG: hypothetical protein MUD08_04380 [Cytophagales bacterium]|nr:hypothetical protein [Cytophagales bacterium]
MPKSVDFYTGDLDRRTNAFYAPSLSVKDTCHVFDFTTETTTTQTFGVEGKIARLRFSIDSAFVYLTTEANVLHCFDRNLQPVWQTDFKRLGKQGGRIYPSGIFSSEDGKLLCLCAVDTETNNWGADYVIDASNGEIVKQIEGYQFRGRLACDFFGNKLLTYNLTTLDLITGEVSAKTIF